MSIALTGDYHTHTYNSHGEGTIEQNVVAAIERGLRDIAITDHGFNSFKFYMQRDKASQMRHEVDRLKGIYGSRINILLGIEANIISFDGTIDVPEDMLEYFDILLAGYHPFVWTKAKREMMSLLLFNISSVSRLLDRFRQKMTDMLIAAMERYSLDILTHPGLGMPIDIMRLADAASQSGTLLEINSNHAVLKPESVKKAAETGAKFVINSDAHWVCEVGDMSRGVHIAKKAELPADRIANSSAGERFLTRSGWLMGGML